MGKRGGHRDFCMISVLPLLVLTFIHFFMIFIHPHLGVSEAVTQYLVVEGEPWQNRRRILREQPLA